MKKLSFFVLSMIFYLFASTINATELKFGVYTSDKASVMYKKFKPIINYLEKNLKEKGIDTKVRLKIYPTYESAIDGLANGEYDFGRFGPASYILTKEKNPNVKLLVMEHKKGKKVFNGVFIAKNNNKIKSLLDLNGKSFAFGSSKSTIGRYLSQAELLKAGISSKELKSFKYLGRHDKVALAVINGDFDAGAVKEKTFKKYKKRGLKSIGKFDNVTKPWIVKANMNVKIYNALQDAMIKLKDKKVLKVFKGDGFIKTNDSEYNKIRIGMNLSKRF